MTSAPRVAASAGKSVSSSGGRVWCAPRRTPHAAPAHRSLANVEDVLRTSGAPLDSATRTLAESRFGHDFSRVRIHTDARAAQSARDLNARAYAVGRHIAFAAGQYAPLTRAGTHLLAHELAHTIQQEHAPEGGLTLADGGTHERLAQGAADAVRSGDPVPNVGRQSHRAVARAPHETEEAPRPDGGVELDPNLFVKPMNAPAERESAQCEEFPGGSTDCEVDEATGTPTGKVKKRVDETNPCTRPCVDQHESVHVKQLRTFCPQLRKCYLDSDAGKRPAADCFKMAAFGMQDRECEAYKVSVPCVEKRLRTAPECKSATNKAYGTRKLASEKCFRDKACGGR